MKRLALQHKNLNRLNLQRMVKAKREKKKHGIILYILRWKSGFFKTCIKIGCDCNPRIGYKLSIRAWCHCNKLISDEYTASTQTTHMLQHSATIQFNDLFHFFSMMATWWIQIFDHHVNVKHYYNCNFRIINSYFFPMLWTLWLWMWHG